MVTLAAKLMLALLPPQSTFFKFQIDDSKLTGELPPEVPIPDGEGEFLTHRCSCIFSIIF